MEVVGYKISILDFSKVKIKTHKNED